MKKSLILFIGFWLAACTATKPLIPANSFDDKLSRSIHKVERKSVKTKDVKNLEFLFDMANTLDVLTVDSLLNLQQVALWPPINAYHRRIQERQNRIQQLGITKTKDGYRPQFAFKEDITAAENASRQKAAEYLYDKANTELSLAYSGNRLIARNAYNTLSNLKENYYPVWEASDAKMAEALEMGTSRFLVEKTGYWAFHTNEFWRGMTQFGTTLNNSTWQKIDEQPVENRRYDYLVQLQLVHLDIGNEQVWHSTNTYSKEIQVGEKVTKDTSGQVIERIPIMEKVCATVTEVRITKSASVQLFVDVTATENNTSVYQFPIQNSLIFDRSWVTITGDQRALDNVPICTGFGLQSAPSDWTMVEDLARETSIRLNQEWDWYCSAF
jgi:hypothetical protein